MNVSVVIPVYNEGSYLKTLIQTLNKSSFVKEIIVVDDGSDQSHREFYQSLSGIKLISNPKNLGKTSTVRVGFENAKGDHVLLMDGDLVGVTVNHIDTLIPLISDKEVMLIFRGGEGKFFKWIGMTYVFRGEHLFSQDFIKNYSQELFDGSRWNFESNVNYVLFNHRVPFLCCELQGVNNRLKFEKYGLLTGALSDIRMVFGIIFLKNKFFGYLIILRKLLPYIRDRIIVKP